MADIRFQNVRKSFGKFAAVDGVDLEVKDGEFMVLLGPVGVRQDDAPALPGRARAGGRGAGVHRRPRRHRPPTAPAAHRDGLPELCGLPAHEGLRQHRLRAANAEGEEGRDRRAGALIGRAVAHRGAPRPLLVAAVRGTATARRCRACDRHEGRRPAHGRAALESRCPAPARDARRAEDAAAEPRRDDDLRHARPDRGAEHG